MDLKEDRFGRGFHPGSRLPLADIAMPNALNLSHRYFGEMKEKDETRMLVIPFSDCSGTP